MGGSALGALNTRGTTSRIEPIAAKPIKVVGTLRHDVPTLVVHGDDDQVVPIDIMARIGVKLIPNATLKVYSGAPHALTTTHRDQLNADILEFIRGIDT